jgi:hypothetical protein
LAYQKPLSIIFLKEETKMNVQYPLVDNNMTYDYVNHRYILTKEYVLQNLKIDLDSKYNGDGNAVLEDISCQVYDFIHQFNSNTLMQDFIIAKTYGGREIIKEAMTKQLKYVLVVGNLRYSMDIHKRALWFDEGAQNTLYKTIPEIGTTICYTGNLCFNTVDKSRW